MSRALADVVVPDLGTDEEVDVVEVLVAAGDHVDPDDGLVTLESDKASMDVPAPRAGTVVELAVKPGDKVRTGSLLLRLEPSESPEASEAPEVSEQGSPDSGPEPAATAAAKPSVPAVADDSIAAAPASGPSQGPAPEPSRDSGPAAAPGEAARVEPPGKRLVVIGAGPGGYTAAFRAADLGLEVTLIEKYPTLGGVCLNVGCIPSKALLHVAEVMREVRNLAGRGVSYGEPKIDLDRLRAAKDEVVAKLTGGLAMMAKQRGVTVVEGTARFAGPTELEVATTEGAETLSFDQAIVAAGSRVTEIPGIPYDDPRVLDSTGALELPEIPDRLLVVGGGIIGLEMATVYAALGSRIAVVELLDGLIPGCDRDLVRPLEHHLKKDLGVEILLETRVAAIEAEPGGLVARFEGAKAPESAEFDRVLVAVGRRPNGDRLNLEASGVAVDERGYVPVDRAQRTGNPRIFAIGDIVGEPMLAHKAIPQGKVAAENAAGEPSAFDARVIPAVAYTDPEVAWVGLTETEAKASDVAYSKGVFPWAASGRSLAMGNDAGSTKILFDPETRRVVGGGIVGPGAGELIAEIALAIEMDAEAADLALTVHPHPTLSESVGLAAEVFEGTITDLYLRKRKKGARS